MVAAPDAAAAGDALAAAAIGVMDEWGAEKQYADGSLPALGCYGVPASWPHIRNVYLRAGFAFNGRVELVLVARVDELPRLSEPPLPGLTARREVGRFGTQLSAFLDGARVGLVDTDNDLTAGGTRSRFAGWADVGNLHVVEEHRRKGVATWLLAHSAD